MLIKCTRTKGVCVIHPAKDEYRSENERLLLNGNCYAPDYTRLSSEEVYYALRQDFDGLHSVSAYPGAFSIIFYQSGANERLFFCNDRLNIARLYYYFDEDQLILADKVDAIVNCLEKELTIDFTAWSEFITLYYVCGNRTFFKEIKSLYLGESLNLDFEKWELRSEIDDSLYFIQTDDAMSYIDAVSTSVNLIKQSIHKIFSATGGRKKIITLSGGWDSRTIAAAASQIRREEIETYTAYIDNGNDEEERYAKQVAEYLAIHNEFFDLDRDYFLNELRGYLYDVDYFSTMHIPFWNYYKKFQDHEGIVLDGLLGDLLFRGMKLPVPSAEPGTKDYFKQCFDKSRTGKPEQFLSASMKTGVPALAMEGLMEEIIRCHYNLRLFVISNRARVISFTVWKQTENREVLLPFCDKELLEFALTIPLQYVQDQRFYPDIMERLYPGIGSIPSTNDAQGKNAYFEERAIYRCAPEVREYFKTVLGRHYTETYGFYNSLSIYKLLNGAAKFSLSTYKGLDLFLFYQLWLDQYKSRLIGTDIFDYAMRNLHENDMELGKQPVIVYIPSEYTAETQKWLNFYNKYKKSEDATYKMDFLCTMDVEAFDQYDLWAKHTAVSSGGCFPLLLKGAGTVERLHDQSAVPFTFFVELYSSIFRGGNQEEILKLCAGNGHEAGLHCHGFSIDREILGSLGLQCWDYMDKDGLEKIIRYGVDIYKKILGEVPFSYRAGSFEVFDGHFNALSKNGIKVDSSLYHASKGNYSEYNDMIQNQHRYYDDGKVLMLPVTTYYDINKQGAICKFDFNLTSFPQKLELISKNLLNHTEYLMLLSHSWSFCKFDYNASLSKNFHTEFSETAWDEFKYLVDFIHQTGMINFMTCKKYAEKVASKNLLVDITGEDVPNVSYRLNPQYGNMRDRENIDCFVDLTSGRIENNCKGEYPYDRLAPLKVTFSLSKSSVPMQGDRTSYIIDIPCTTGKKYSLDFVLESHYYVEKFEGRDRIKYSVAIDSNEIYYNFVTSPLYDNIISCSGKTLKGQIHFVVTLECLENEMPWNWGGKSSMLELKHMYLDMNKRSMINNSFILFDHINDIASKKSKNIILEPYPMGVKLSYDRISEEDNNYLVFWGESLTKGPSAVYGNDCKVPQGNKRLSYVLLNFKARGILDKHDISVFFITYDDYDGTRISSQSKRVNITSQDKYHTLHFDVMPEAKVYKIALKLSQEIIKDCIIIQEMEIIFY